MTEPRIARCSHYALLAIYETDNGDAGGLVLQCKVFVVRVRSALTSVIVLRVCGNIAFLDVHGLNVSHTVNTQMHSTSRLQLHHKTACRNDGYVSAPPCTVPYSITFASIQIQAQISAV